jgi:hypothetical protein
MLLLCAIKLVERTPSAAVIPDFFEAVNGWHIGKWLNCRFEISEEGGENG